MNKIYIFAHAKLYDGADDWNCYALSEDGRVLGWHICSHEVFVSGDLGNGTGWRENYEKHYPNGYELEFVPLVWQKDHAGLQAAIALNLSQPEQEAA